KEGLLLDPVYTSKAMAALVSDVRNGTAGDGPVLFWHTGGAPALFAYRNELT
ncbi:MAG: D-cysteine desulfhydrase, partial [Deltaproteobacteria bacterium]|nr:D-cysteine desulfhydrase [Deltaproteobacteria bacterium]